MAELGPLGPILGTNECAHTVVTYYDSGYVGVYAVCHACGGHFWNTVVPEGAEVIDLMAMADEAPDECSHGIPIDEDCTDCEELTRQMHEYNRGQHA